jgi:hypothetical protein
MHAEHFNMILFAESKSLGITSVTQFMAVAFQGKIVFCGNRSGDQLGALSGLRGALETVVRSEVDKWNH